MASNFSPDYEYRFFSRVKIYRHTDCWLWTGGKTNHGYGVFRFQGGATTAHRVAHQLMLGPVPDGYHVDHLCRNPSCVNPEHLEAVTPKENSRRGVAARRVATHCFLGHELNGYVNCATCREIRAAAKSAA